MKALRFHYSLPRLACTRVSALATPRALVSAVAPVCLEEVREPEPGGGWVVCDTVVAGICGSDAKQVFPKDARVVLDPWLPRFAAHESRLHPVPRGVGDAVAVLADPVSVALRQVLRTPPAARSR